MNTIEVVIENTHERRYVKQGISLLELVQEYYTELGRWPLQSPVLGALVNNEVTDLHYRLYNPKTIRFFDINCTQGWRMYQASLTFLLYKAARDVYPKGEGCQCSSRPHD